MKKILSLTIAAAAIAASPAHAQDSYYLGATIANSNAKIRTKAGTEVESSNSPTPVKLHGGWNINENLAIEAGYGRIGALEFDKAKLGASDDLRIKSTVMYVAAKGTMALGASFSLFGKVGIVRNEFDLSGGTGGSLSMRSTRPMLGVGAGYKLTDSVALTLEVEHFGKTRSHNTVLSHNRLEAGVKFSF